MLPAPGSELTTAEQMIEALGGPATVAAFFKLDSYRVTSMWRKRQRIPQAYRPEIARLVEVAGYRVPDDFLTKAITDEQ